MFNYYRKELEWGGLYADPGDGQDRPPGRWRRDGALRRHDLLCTAVGVKSSRPGQDFFPLTVNYQERPSPPARSPAASSSGKAGPSEVEVLNPA